MTGYHGKVDLKNFRPPRLITSESYQDQCPIFCLMLGFTISFVTWVNVWYFRRGKEHFLYNELYFLLLSYVSVKRKSGRMVFAQKVMATKRGNMPRKGNWNIRLLGE